MNIVAYFYERADVAGPDECWNWQLSCNRKGYGYFWHPERKKLLIAHRFAYELANKEIPEDMLVCHTCDNPPCVNFKHLFLGTNYDNMHDMIDKGRAPSHVGTSNPRARLTEDDVVLIRELYRTTPASQSQLAKAFGVAQQTISSVIQSVNWSHIS